MKSYLCMNSRVMEFRMFLSSPGSVCVAPRSRPRRLHIAGREMRKIFSSGVLFIDWNAKPCGVFFCQNQALRPPVTNCKAAAKPSRAQVEADPSQFRCAWYHQKSFILLLYLIQLVRTSVSQLSIDIFLIIHFYTNDNCMLACAPRCTL